MLKPFYHLIVNILVLLGLSLILPNLVFTVQSAALLVIFLTILNWTVVPIIKFFTFPINILSLGICYFIINLLTIWLVFDLVGVRLGRSFGESFLNAILVIFALSIGNNVAQNLAKDKH